MGFAPQKNQQQRLQKELQLHFSGWKSWRGQILMEEVQYRSSFQLCGVEWFKERDIKISCISVHL